VFPVERENLEKTLSFQEFGLAVRPMQSQLAPAFQPLLREPSFTPRALKSNLTS
jgi:hypothetical protein